MISLSNLDLKDLNYSLWKETNKENVNNLSLIYADGNIKDSKLNSSDYYYSSIAFILNPVDTNSMRPKDTFFNKHLVTIECSNYKDCKAKKREIKAKISTQLETEKVKFINKKPQMLLKKFVASQSIIKKLEKASGESVANLKNDVELKKILGAFFEAITLPENDVDVKSTILKIKNEMAKDVEKFIDLFGGCDAEIQAKVREAITKDIENLAAIKIEFPNQMLELFNDSEIQRLNAIAVNQNKCLKDSSDDEAFSMDFFGDEVSSEVNEGGPVPCIANEDLMQDLQCVIAEIEGHCKTLTQEDVLAIYAIKSRPKITELLLGKSNPTELQQLIIDAAYRIINANGRLPSAEMDKFLSENPGAIQQARPIQLANSPYTEFSIIEKLIKEQKKHVFQRFTRLEVIYKGFVKRANLLIQKVEEMQPGAGADIAELLKKTVATSYLEDSEFVNPDIHHDHGIMGSEPQPISKTDLSSAVDHLNWLLRAPVSKQFERAHTFPFPTMMCWNLEKWAEHLSDLGYTNLVGNRVESPVEGKKISLSKSGFIEVKGQPKNGDVLFEKTLQQIQDSANGNVGVFIMDGIKLLKDVHLSLLSETEHMPDFVNKYFDTLSEWKLGGDNNYKKTLATYVLNLLNQASEDPFQTYLSESEKQVEQCLEKLLTKKGTVFCNFYKICVLQTKQALIIAKNAHAIASKAQ